MGLPAFVAPPSPTAPSAVEKAASESRSSIRRQRPAIRPRPHARSSGERHRRRMIEIGVLDTNAGDYEDWERHRRSPPNESQPSSFAAAAHARAHNLHPSRARDSYERRYPAGIEVDGPIMPPVPESRDYNAYSQRTRGMAVRDIRRMARRRPAPTPPSREADIEPLRRMGSDSPGPLSMNRPIGGRDRLRTLSYSEARDDDYPGLSIDEPEVSPRSFGLAPQSFRSDRHLRSSLSERVHTLSWAADANRRPRPAAADGLGDRDRSLSPEGGAAWDTLQGSITPDPQPPSAGSSFASASASAAASSNAGPASASTSMTSLGMTEDSSTFRDCDLSDVSDSEAGIDEDEDELNDRQAFNQATRGERFWRTYANVVTARADRVARSTYGDTEHLGGMHRIISRLAERDDIPDEWWAGAGLRREPPLEGRERRN